MTFRPRAWILPAILALGLALRLWVAAHVAVIAGDGITRIGLAKVFRDRGLEAGLEACLVPGYHPFNPILIRLLGALTGDLERSAVAVSLGFGILGILGVFLLVREAWGEREAHLAALFWALLPNAVAYSADVLTEGQFLAFWVFTAWSGLVALKGRGRGWALLAGALAGLAYETRPEGTGIVLALGVALACLAWRDRRSGAGRRVLQAALLGTGFLCMALPYLWHLRQAKGEWMLTPHKSVLNLLTRRKSVWNPPAPALQDAPASTLRGRTALVEYSELVRKGVRSVTPWMAALAFLGLWKRRPWGAGGIFLLGLAALHAAVVLRLFQTAGYASHRHFMTLAVPAVAWGAAGGAWGLAALLGRGRRAWALGAGLVLCAALLAEACQPVRADKAYRRDFGLWLAAHAEPDAWVATLVKPEIPYYARRRGLDWSAAPAYYLDRPDARQLPQLLVLDLDTGDRRWAGAAAAHPQFSRVPLPAPHDGRFAVFRRDWASVRTHPIIRAP